MSASYYRLDHPHSFAASTGHSPVEQYSFPTCAIKCDWRNPWWFNVCPRLRGASGLVDLTNDELRLRFHKCLLANGLRRSWGDRWGLRHMGNRDQNRIRTVTKTMAKRYVQQAAPPNGSPRLPSNEECLDEISYRTFVFMNAALRPFPSNAVTPAGLTMCMPEMPRPNCGRSNLSICSSKSIMRKRVYE